MPNADGPDLSNLREALRGLKMVHDGLADPTRSRQTVGEVAAHWVDRVEKMLAAAEAVPAAKEKSSAAVESDDVNSWFLSLEPGHQAVLREDKWTLASAAFRAGLERRRPATIPDPTPEPKSVAATTPSKPWGYSFMRSNGDDTDSQEIVQGEIPSGKVGVRDVVALHATPAPSRAGVPTTVEAGNPSMLSADYEERLAGFRKALDETKADAERWRAFVTSERFTVMGSAGFDSVVYPQARIAPGHDPEKAWLHFTLNVWDKHPAGGDEQGTHGRNLLLAYVEHRRGMLPTKKGEVR